MMRWKCNKGLLFKDKVVSAKSPLFAGFFMPGDLKTPIWRARDMQGKKRAKKRSLQVVNEHASSAFKRRRAAARQIGL